MARFILLWTPDNDIVDKILKKITKLQEKLPVKVVGQFNDPQVFCDKSCGRQNSEAWRKNNPALTHPVWGTVHCPLCKKPIKSYAIRLRNSMEPKYLAFDMTTLALYLTPPADGSLYNGRSVEEIYGEDAVNQSIENRKQTLRSIRKYKAEGGISASARRARRRRSRRTTNG